MERHAALMEGTAFYAVNDGAKKCGGFYTVRRICPDSCNRICTENAAPTIC